VTIDNCEACVDDGRFCTRLCDGDHDDYPQDQNFTCIGYGPVYNCHVNCGVGRCDS